MNNSRNAHASKSKPSSRALTLLLIATLGLTGCSNQNSLEAEGGEQPNKQVKSRAYKEGFKSNTGASPDEVRDYGGKDAYCNAVLALLSEYDAQEQQDYLLGCFEAVPSPAPIETAEPPGVNLNDTLLNRLNDSGGARWSEDPFTLISDITVGFKSNYLSDGCTLWVFDDQESAEATYDNGFFNIYSDYQLSIGTDANGDGVMAMFMDSSAPCGSDMLYALNWTNF